MVILLLLCFFFYRNGVWTRYFMEIRTLFSCTRHTQLVSFTMNPYLLRCFVFVFRYRFGSWAIQIVICIGAVSQDIHFDRPFGECVAIHSRAHTRPIVRRVGHLGRKTRKCIANANAACVPPAFDSNYAFRLIYAIALRTQSPAVVTVHLSCTLHRMQTTGNDKATMFVRKKVQRKFIDCLIAFRWKQMAQHDAWRKRFVLFRFFCVWVSCGALDVGRWTFDCVYEHQKSIER